MSTSKRNKNRLLVIGMINSPHLSSWMKACSELKIFDQLIVFPSDTPREASNFEIVSCHDSGTKVRAIKLLRNDCLNYLGMHALDLLTSKAWRRLCLFFFIRFWKPRVVHYHELQHSGYLLATLGKTIEKLKPSINIIGSTWGSDLKFFAYVDSHQKQIQNVLKLTDILTAERESEQEELSMFRFEGKFLAPLYISVGVDEAKIKSRQAPSASRKILVKGYQHDQGRGLNALKAIELISEDLQHNTILVFATEKSPSVRLQINVLRRKYGLDIDILPKLPHKDFLDLFYETRVYVGVNEVDGLSTSMAESMARGVFPVQSANSGAETFIINGVNGFAVDPWNIEEISECILRAVKEDDLVDSAAVINQTIIAKKYSRSDGLKEIEKLYGITKKCK